MWLIFWLVCPVAVLAYRPFSSTDAAVAEKGVSEVELGVFNYAHSRSRDILATPEIRYNLGIATNWEAVLEGALQVYDSASRHDLQLIEPQFNLKTVLLEGPLQEGRFPISLATEIGALLPETVRGSGAGFQGVLIGSWRVGKYTFHVNGGGGVEREFLEPLGLWGLIVERPIAPNLRLATEINGQFSRRSRADNSALLGLLWDHRKVTYDAAVRFGLSQIASDIALTTGLTFRF